MFRFGKIIRESRSLITYQRLMLRSNEPNSSGGGGELGPFSPTIPFSAERTHVNDT
jgi:hypothetical protein